MDVGSCSLKPLPDVPSLRGEGGEDKRGREGGMKGKKFRIGMYSPHFQHTHIESVIHNYINMVFSTCTNTSAVEKKGALGSLSLTSCSS